MKKKMIVIGCLVTLVLAIIIPIFIDYCILGNGIKSNVGNDVWMSFFGSYFGGLFGAFATMVVFCFTFLDSEKRRIEAEKKRKEEQDNQWRLSILPCLQVRERAVPEKEELEVNGNIYFICFEGENIKQKRNISKMMKLGYHGKFIIESELRNVGMGSAVSLNIFANEKQVLFNESLIVEQVLKIYYVFELDEVYHREINIKFEYSDTRGLTKYKQDEIFLLYRTNTELNWEHKQYLTMPSIIQNEKRSD